MDLEKLAKDVMWLKDIEEIKQLQYEYMYLLGTFGSGKKVADLFTDDGKAEIQDSGIFQGKKAIAWFFDEIDAAGYEGVIKNYQYTMTQGEYPILWPGECLAANPRIKINGITAKGQWFMFGFYTLPYADGLKAIWNAGKYENEYKKVDGVWKISFLHFLTNFETTYEQGWAKQPMICSYARFGEQLRKKK